LQREPVVVDDFLSEQECERIRTELDFTFWRPSLTYQRQPDDVYRHVLTDPRVSDTAHQDLFSNELLELLGEVEARLRASFGVEPVRRRRGRWRCQHDRRRHHTTRVRRRHPKPSASARASRQEVAR
jgi:hypothetical protein